MTQPTLIKFYKHCTCAFCLHCSSQALADLKRLTEKMRDQLTWSDTDLLRALLVFLTQELGEEM